MKPRGTILQLAASPDGDLAIVRQDMSMVGIHDIATGQCRIGLTPHVRSGIQGEVAFDRKNPSFVALHALPLTRTAALAAVRALRDAEAPCGLDGTRCVAEPVGQR